MRRPFLLLLAVAGASPLLAQKAKPAAAAPAPTATIAGGQFRTGVFYAGPRIWLGNLNGSTAIGGQVERGFTQAGKYGPGIIAGGVGVDWYSWSRNYGGLGKYSYTVVPVQLFGNYHFPVKDYPKLDPYAGLALVYSHVSASWDGAGTASSANASGTDVAGQAGVRWFFSDNLSASGQLGFGYGTLGIGAAWRF